MENEIKEGTYSVSNNQPIVPRVYISDDKEMMVKILDRIITDEKT